MINRGSRILLSQRRFQNQKEAHGLRSSRVRVLTRKTNLKTRSTKSSLLSLEKFLETAKGLQLLQEIERKNADNAGVDVEELDSSDSDNDQHFRQNARRLRILLDEMSEQGHFQGSNSSLELRSVSGTTRNKYRAATQKWSDKMKVPLATESELDAGLAQWMNMMYAEGHRAWQGERWWQVFSFSFQNTARPATCPFRGLSDASRVGENCPRRFHETAHVASVVCHGRRDDQAWTPLLSIMVLLSIECYLRPSEALSLTGQSLLPPATSAVPHWVVLLFPQENRQRSKVGAADDTEAIDSGRANWMQRVFPVLANQQKSQLLFQTDDQQHWDRSGALPDAAFRAFVGPRSGNKGHHFLPKTGTLGNNDQSQAIRKARTPQRHMESPFARNPSVLPHVRARRRGLYFGGRNMPFATEAGRISSKHLAEISRQLK